jgi:DNA-binding response OmpR family regulator
MSDYGEPRQHQGDAFLAKPFDIDELGMLVEAHLPNSG